VGRPARIQYPDAIYHVWTNGNRDRAIFDDVDDREVHLGFLDHVTREHGWSCYAYCQMTTHFHLLVQTPEPNLDRTMHRLNSGYARYNRRHGQSGHFSSDGTTPSSC